MDVLHHAILVFNPPSDHGPKLATWGQRREAEHVEQLAAILVAVALPVFERADLIEATVGDSGGLGLEVSSERGVTGCGVGGRTCGVRGDGQGEHRLKRECQQ